MIKVKYCNGLFMVWNVDDVIHLRKDYRIVGNLVGSLPEFPRQPTDFGLPLILMNEEIRLLDKLGIVSIVTISSDSYLQCFLSDECRTHYDRLKSEQYDEINQRFKEARKLGIEDKFEKICEGKLKKMKTVPVEKELEEFRAKLRFDLLNSIHDIPRNENSLSTRFYIETQQPSLPEFEFKLPYLCENSLDLLKFNVFEEFWNKGYYLTDGIKFGAHFLAYDHDPSGFHSKFIIVCCPDLKSHSLFENTLLQAYGRLGKNVRKNVILAHFTRTESSRSIEFKNVQWNLIGID